MELAIEQHKTRIQKLIDWREAHISNRNFIIFLALLIGFFAAVATSLLHWLIGKIQYLLTEGFNVATYNWMYLVFPVIGIILTTLFVKYVVKDKISHGITRVLYAIATKNSHLKPHNCWTSLVASAVTVGFGGSVGAEAPIVMTGAAIGSNLGTLFKMDNKTLMLLVGCGAAAAISGIFKAPIAGLVFTLEVLMIDLTMASLLPILVSCVTATCASYVFTGNETTFAFRLDDAWELHRLPATIFLGLFCGFISLYFIRGMSACENFFAKLKNHPYYKILIGGGALSVLIFFFPSLYGEGYSALNILLNGNNVNDWNSLMDNSLFYGSGNLLILYIIFVIVTKVLATSATNGSGGCGGTLVPSLFIGGFSGFLFARLWNMQKLGVYIPEKNFTLMGMAGVLTGVMHAPLTGIFLIAEITGGYTMFLPLMIVCICSYLTINIFETHSIYSIRLAHEGKLITHNTDHAALTLMNISDIIERDYTPVSPDMPMADLVKAINKSHTTFLPVLDKSMSLVGVIDFVKIRHIIFRTELYNKLTVSQLMQPSPAVLGVNDHMDEVMRKFDSTDASFLPVMDLDGKMIGLISRNRMYMMYRKMVEDLSEE